MYHLLYSFCEWLQNTQWALYISGSTWIYPYVQMIHFTGLSLWVGTNLALDLSLLGVGRRRQTPGELSDSLFVWNWTGLGVAVTGGFMLFATAATTFVINPAFRLKLGVLIPVALILHIIVQQKARTWGQTMDTPPIAKLAGLTEILLWVGVATAAVSIPIYEHLG
jgi:hypothetical protein